MEGCGCAITNLQGNPGGATTFISVVRRLLKIIGWSVGVLVLLIGLVGVASYVFVTSDYVRAQIENHANAVSGRKTKIARISVDWGWTPHVHLDDVELSNADWGKADHMFKAQQIEFDIRLWPLLHGDIVLPRLMLRKPELYLERNAQDRVELEPERKPGCPRRGEAGPAAAPPSDAPDRPAGDHRRACRLHRPEAQARPQRVGVDGNGSGRR